LAVGVEELIERHELMECIQCGVCTGGCPMSIKVKLNPRQIMRFNALFRELEIPPEEQLWGCTTCATCEIRCPKELSPVSFLISLRGILIEQGKIPTTLRDALESVYVHGNPWTRGREKRMEWAEGLNVPHISEVSGERLLYFVGCTPSYDTRGQLVARSMVEILNSVGLSFGVLGKEENCCGNEVYGMGEEGLFEELRESNIELFKKYKVDAIFTTCPHGYNAFKNLYEGLEVSLIQHHSQLLSSLIDQDKLQFKGRVEATVAYHDPCFLGKRNSIFDEPRHVIENIPGVNFVELDRIRTRSLCCEGGGGRMWYEVPGRRLAEIRVEEAVEVGADILAVACPFCLATLDDAAKTAGYEEKLRVMDIAELVAQALRPS